MDSSSVSGAKRTASVLGPVKIDADPLAEKGEGPLDFGVSFSMTPLRKNCLVSQFSNNDEMF